MVLTDYGLATGYNKDVIRADLERICGKIPENAKEMCSLVMHTAYMATSNSSEKTRNRAQELAEDIGSNHMAGSIEEIW
jgi:hypothetical protein